ncbi:uncharacterized protein LOC106136447 [Amyelois transitella]|uniref:uncharacterized protein LOC106136447 n=1 Tax=Amyelois transitella TaxID=680683 RepID=UPI00067E218B|nr:uncharacterized protein LOC106136447 [Amyelois transitella]
MDTTEKTFRDLLEKVAKEQNYKEYWLRVTPVSTGGANFSSTLYKGTISAPKRDTLKVFGKVVIVSAKLREEMGGSAFDVERIAYTELLKIYEQIELKHNIPDEDRLVFCKYYGCNANEFEETIILEDLTAKGFTLHDRMKSVDWPYASKAIEVLAKFHALSMCYAEEYPDNFERHSKELSSILGKISDVYNKGLRATLPLSTSVIKEENKARFEAFFANEDKVNFEQMFTPVRKSVIMHGDYRPSNLMHRNNKDGSVDVIALDLQTLQPCSGVIDLLYFIFMATDQEFRKQYYTKLVDHYYATLSRMLRAYGLNPDKVYSRGDFDFELKERLHFGLVIATFGLPIVTVESEDAPNFAEEGASMDSFMVKTGKNLPARINGVVDDFIAWGLL